MFIRNDTNASYVRVFHASPDAPPVDIYINNNLVFKSLAFGNFTEYMPLSMGNYKIEVYPEGKRKIYFNAKCTNSRKTSCNSCSCRIF